MLCSGKIQVVVSSHLNFGLASQRHLFLRSSSGGTSCGSSDGGGGKGGRIINSRGPDRSSDWSIGWAGAYFSFALPMRCLFVNGSFKHLSSRELGADADILSTKSTRLDGHLAPFRNLGWVWNALPLEKKQFRRVPVHCG